jgi:Uma2 family endonuclease
MSTVQEKLYLGPELAGSLMTAVEFDAAEDADELYVYELIHGVFIVTPPPSEGERGPNELLGRLLWNYQERHPQGSALDYTLTEHTVHTFDNRRRADRVIWTGLGRVPNVRRELPTIVVEFVSAGRRSRQRDYDAKREEYLDAGVAEYWVIDRFRRQMTVFRQPSTDVSKLVVREGEVYTTPLLPGFELPVTRLLAEADMLAQAELNDPDASQP